MSDRTAKYLALPAGVFDNDRGHFRRDGPPVNRDNKVPPDSTAVAESADDDE